MTQINRNESDAPASPCVGVCRLDAQGQVCIGCRRTLDEIAAWPGMAPGERAAIIERLKRQEPASGRLLPARIVCLTEEPTEVLYAIGEEHRIAGISGFTVRPARARREKPKVSAFTTANIERILAVEPDFAIGFSDLQADIAQALIRAGVEVWISNHRTVAGILAYVRRLGALVGAAERAERYAERLEQGVERVRAAAQTLPRRPRVYFEEWDEPMISAISWVSELIAIAGGTDIFAERAPCKLARDRIVADPTEVVRRAPDLIIGSWCGKKFRPEKLAARAGWADIPAIRSGRVYELKSPIILQPGPAALTDGLEQLAALIGAASA